MVDNAQVFVDAAVDTVLATTLSEAIDGLTRPLPGEQWVNLIRSADKPRRPQRRYLLVPVPRTPSQNS